MRSVFLNVSKVFDVESAIHFFRHCPLCSNERRTLMNSLVNIDHTLLDNTDFSLFHLHKSCCLAIQLLTQYKTHK